MTIEIRTSEQRDLSALEQLYPAAFPDEDLVPLVRDLLQAAVEVLSLVAVTGSQIVGHVVFTPGRVSTGGDKVALLGPLAVAPHCQRQGVGSALVGEGLQRLRETRVGQVLVLGDPAYYGRLGFSPEAIIQPPYPLPDAWQNAWQSRTLGDATPPAAGELQLPPAWQNPALWGP